MSQSMKTLNAPGDLNISRVLRLIWQRKGISRIEIAQHLGIDKSTVTKIVSALEDIGIIRAFAQGSAGPLGGRKPIQLEIIPDFACALGIEVTTEGFLAVVVNLNGEIVASSGEEIKFASVTDSFESAIASVAPTIERLNVPLIGIGLGVPAIVNTETGTIIQSIPLLIHDKIEFSAWARDRYETPVYVENDARCGCLGEITMRHGMNLDNALFLLSEIRRITGSTESRKNLSVGFGFIINGQPHYGSGFFAGEFRSIMWEEGNAGQFQSNDATGDRIGSDETVTGPLFTELARHAALLANMLDLSYVFLGGLPDALTENLATKVRAELRRNWPYSATRECSVLPASLGLQAVAYGAAGHCLQRFFSLPNIYQPSGTGPSVKETLSMFRGTD
jgi:predicted NBD/HSP70 family sugar kinase